MGNVYYLFRHSDRTAFCIGKAMGGIPDAVLADASGQWMREFSVYPAEMAAALPARFEAEDVCDGDGFRTACIQSLRAFLVGGTDFEVIGDESEAVSDRFAVGFRLVGTVYLQGQPEYEAKLAKDADELAQVGARVAEVEATIREVETARSSEAPAVTSFQRELLARLPTFTPGMDGRLLEGDDLRAARRLVLSGLAVRTSPQHFARTVAHIDELASRKTSRKRQ